MSRRDPLRHNRTRGAVFLAGALAVGAGLGVAWWKGHSAGGAQTTAAASAADRDAETRADRLASVEETVAERNRASERERDVFRADGWEIVQGVEAPDARLTELDPSLIRDGREKDLRIQLASTVPGRRQAGKVKQIARDATDPATRYAAVEALGRIKGEEGQRALLELLVDEKMAQDPEAHAAIAPRIRPRDLDDAVAGEMVRLLDSPAITPVARQQMAFTLALVGLRDGMALPDETLASLAPSSQKLLAEMTDLASRGMGRRMHYQHEPVRDHAAAEPSFAHEETLMHPSQLPAHAVEGGTP